MELGHLIPWGDTAEESHPSHHGGLFLTLPVNLPREARGLADHILFSFPLEIIWWVEWDGLKHPFEVSRDCALAKTADNHSIGGSVGAQQQQIGWKLGSLLMDSKCQMRHLCIQGI